MQDIQNIEFNDEFENDPGMCSICGGDTNLTGWNEEKDLSRFECEECGAIFICDSDYNKTIVKGEKRNWENYLSENLTFPFKAFIDEFQERGPLRSGDKIIVEKIIDEDDFYGVLVKVKRGREYFDFPLCDIAAQDKKSANYKVLDGYRTWFANCR